MDSIKPINPITAKIKQRMEKLGLTFKDLTERIASDGEKKPIKERTLYILIGDAPTSPTRKPKTYRRFLTALEFTEQEQKKMLKDLEQFIEISCKVSNNLKIDTLETDIKKLCTPSVRKTFVKSLKNKIDTSFAARVYASVTTIGFVYALHKKTNHSGFVTYLLEEYFKLTPDAFLKKILPSGSKGKEILTEAIDTAITNTVLACLNNEVKQDKLSTLLTTSISKINMNKGRSKTIITTKNGTKYRVPIIQKNEDDLRLELIKQRDKDKTLGSFRTQLKQFFKSKDAKLKYHKEAMQILKTLKEEDVHFLVSVKAYINHLKKTTKEKDVE